MSPRIGGTDHQPSMPENDPYLSRVAQECIGYKSEVERIISSMAHNSANAEDIVAQAILRVTVYADQHRSEKQIENVKAFLITTARNLFFDAHSRKLAADKLETVSSDTEASENLLNRVVGSSGEEVLERIQEADLRKLALRDATAEQKRLFHMWFDLGMTAEEIAPKLGVTSAAIRHRLKKIKGMLCSAMSV